MINFAMRLTARAALAGAAVLGLAAIPLASSAAGSPSSSSCSAVANPLGAAQGWTEFIEGRDNRHSSESEGSVALGGDLTIGQVDIHGSNGNPATVRLVVGGKISNGGAPAKLEHGSAWVTDRAGSTPFFNNPPNPGAIEFHQASAGYAPTNPIDFASAFADLRAKSTAWATAAQTGTVTVGTGGESNNLVLTGSNGDLNVFNVTAAQLSSTQGVSINTPNGSTTLINVSGTSVQIGNGSAAKMWLKQGGTWKQAADNTINQQPGILWNFPTATSVHFNGGGAWGGTYLAPNAAVTVANSIGNNPGQIIAKTFDSARETHLGLFPSSACLPGGGGGGGGGGGTPATPDVQITKTASAATPTGGATFNYRLTARNNGSGQAKDVVVHDTLPLGVTFDSASSGCSVSGVVVTCDAGDLADGASKTFTITVLANPISSGGAVPHSGQQHQLTVSKVEQQVDLNAGETRTVTLTCPDNGILTDGNIRVDAVDQGTGALTDVHVVSSQSTGVSSWQGVVTNGATGRAQTKAFAVCAPAKTESAGGHQHALTASGSLVTTTQAWGAGRQTATVTCPSGTMPIAPGFAFAGGAATLAGSEPGSGGAWTFTVDVASPTTATLSARCLDDDVASADGHTHALVTEHVVKTFTVPAGQTLEEQVICADDAKGIVGSWMLPVGVDTLGNDARPKTRAYKLVNTTGADQTVVLDLECLNDRTGPEKLAGVSPVAVTNTATITASTSDPVSGNDSSSATVEVQPGSTVACFTSAATSSGSTLALKAVSAKSGPAKLTVKSGRKLLGKGTTILHAGKPKTLRVKLTKAGRRAFRGHRAKKATATLKLKGARARTRHITVH